MASISAGVGSSAPKRKSPMIKQVFVDQNNLRKNKILIQNKLKLVKMEASATVQFAEFQNDHCKRRNPNYSVCCKKISLNFKTVQHALRVWETLEEWEG